MKVSEMCNAIAEHFNNLYLHKLGGSSILIEAGVIIVVTPTHLGVYEIARKRCDHIITELITTTSDKSRVTTSSPIGKLLVEAIQVARTSSRLAHLTMDLCDPESLNKMDALVTTKIDELRKVGKDRWAYRCQPTK